MRVAAYLFTPEYAAPLSGIIDGRETYVPYLGTLCAYEVDVHNPTGALVFYERAGFRTVARFDECTITERPVP